MSKFKRKSLLWLILGAMATVSATGQDAQVCSNNRISSDIIDWSEHQNCWCSGSKAGEIVKYKDFNGIPLLWRADWWTTHDENPGDFIDSGGTSPWTPINSLSKVKSTEYKWVGWNSDCDKFEIGKVSGSHEIKVELVGNWGDQLDKKEPGVYVPTWRDGAEAAYSIIFKGVGVNNYAANYEPAIEVGQVYPWCNWGFAVTSGAMNNQEWDYAVGMVQEGHEILNNGYDQSGAFPLWKWFYIGDTLSNNDSDIPLELQNLVIGPVTGDYKPLVVKIPYYSYDAATKSIDTLYKEMTYSVMDYSFKKDSVLEGGSYRYFGVSTGYMEPVHKGWDDIEGANVDMLKLYCRPGWKETDQFQKHVYASRELINENVYAKADTTGNLSCDYFIYSNDLYANESHDSLIAAGYVGAKGGSRNGYLTPGDFYDPFRTHYDNFLMLDEGATKVFPDNPEMTMSLQGLVDNLIKSKGYMTRVFTGCLDIDMWDDVRINPGSIPKSLFEKHVKRLEEDRQRNRLFVGTPSEVAKYRIMSDAVKSVELRRSPNNEGYILHAEMDSVPEQYQDEISFIVIFEEAHDEMLTWHYTSHENHPIRYRARKLDDAGKAWSVSFNPFWGDFYYEPHICIGEECDHPVNKNATSVIDAKNLLENTRLLRTSDNRISLNLLQGNYRLELFNALGQVVKHESVNIKAQIGTETISTKSLAKGVYFLSVLREDKALLKEKILIR